MLMCRLIEKSISSVYSKDHRTRLHNIGSSSGANVDAMETETSSPNGSFMALPKELFQMLACAGPFLYRDTLLLQKVGHYVPYNQKFILSLNILPLKCKGSFVTLGMSGVESVLLSCTWTCWCW